MEEEKLVNKHIKFTPRMVEMVERIQSELGLGSFSSAVHYAVAETHRKIAPAYAQTGRPGLTPEERVRNRKEQKQAELQSIIDEKKVIAEQLGGEVYQLESGAWMCRYFTYDWNKRYQQEVSLTLLTPELVNNQYFPSREKVEALQKEGKTDY